MSFFCRKDIKDKYKCKLRKWHGIIGSLQNDLEKNNWKTTSLMDYKTCSKKQSESKFCLSVSCDTWGSGVAK